MTEFKRHTTGIELSLNAPSATGVSATLKKDGVTSVVLTGDPVLLPYSMTFYDGEFEVEWRYTVEGDEYTRSDLHNVVTPLFTKEMLVDYSATFSSLEVSKFNILERMVRLIIENYTGQSFGFSNQPIHAAGTGFGVLNVNRHVLSISSLNYTGSSFQPVVLNRDWKITNGGFSITPFAGYTADSIKVPAYEEIINEGGVIYNPYSSHNVLFKHNVSYTVNGEFGWHAVPDAVIQAALILAGEFSCKEATWRDRYITQIRTSDWGYNFHSQAFVGTGSVSADHLLSDYVINTMGMI